MMLPRLTRAVVLALWPVFGYLATRPITEVARVEAVPATTSGRRMIAIAPVVEDSRPVLARKRNPFRVGPGIPSRTLGRESAAAPVDGAPSSRPRVTAFVTGGESAVLVEGMPGTDGPRVLKLGDLVGRFRVTRISLSDILLRSSDSTMWLRIPTAPGAER